MDKNSNKDLYSGKLLKTWSEKIGLLPIEAYFIKKYLINKKGKVVEAGTGGGRIIFEIENQGFTDLHAFDYVEEMIHFCDEKKKQLKSSVNFKIADATNLYNYQDHQFDYLIYLQQVLCFVGKEKLQLGLQEAQRIGRDDATYVFSFLNWNSKWYNPILSMLVNFFRILQNEKTSKYELPWLNIDGKFNWKFLSKNQPNNLWLKEKDIVEILENNAFRIMELKTKVHDTDTIGHLHIACKKAS